MCLKWCFLPSMCGQLPPTPKQHHQTPLQSLTHPYCGSKQKETRINNDLLTQPNKLWISKMNQCQMFSVIEMLLTPGQRDVDGHRWTWCLAGNLASAIVTDWTWIWSTGCKGQRAVNYTFKYIQYISILSKIVKYCSIIINNPIWSERVVTASKTGTRTVAPHSAWAGLLGTALPTAIPAGAIPPQRG